ncbi:MAG: hypothetical protein LC650_01435 [Actinobacteria bacterium]|nr:hypothetical protein [Actinomycetota bacterium]
MTEAKFNTIVRNSLIDSSGFAYKISDVGGGSQQRRPFDGIALYGNEPVFWESKATKGLKAFNLKEVFEGDRGHQMETFETIFMATQKVKLWVILCSYIPRKARVYTFPYRVLRTIYAQGDGKTSILQKDLEALPYTSIFKDRITDIKEISLENLEALEE